MRLLRRPAAHAAFASRQGRLHPLSSSLHNTQNDRKLRPERNSLHKRQVPEQGARKASGREQGASSAGGGSDGVVRILACLQCSCQKPGRGGLQKLRDQSSVVAEGRFTGLKNKQSPEGDGRARGQKPATRMVPAGDRRDRRCRRSLGMRPLALPPVADRGLTTGPQGGDQGRGPRFVSNKTSSSSV